MRHHDLFAFFLGLLATLTLGCLTLLGCGKLDLSRPEAAQQIEKSDQIRYLSHHIPPTPGAIAKGVDQGLWTADRLGPKAGEFIASISISPSEIVLRQPTTIRVAVTGVTGVPGAEGTKEVQFSYAYNELPGLVKRFARAGGTGTAFFRLYDDGWRLERVETRASDRSSELSEKERADEVADLRAATDLRMREAAAKRAEAERVAKRLEESKSPTKVIQALSFACDFARRNVRTQEIRLTDVDVEFVDHFGSKRKVWLGDAIDFHQGPPGSGNTVYLSFSYWSSGGRAVTNSSLVPVERTQFAGFSSMLGQAITAWRTKFAPAATQNPPPVATPNSPT